VSIDDDRWHDFFTSNSSVFLRPFVDIFLQKPIAEKMVEIRLQKVQQKVHALFVSSYF